MGAKVYGRDAEAGKITYVKPEKKAKGKENRNKLSITREQFDKLLTIAVADGFENDADTPIGVRVQNTRQVQNYVRLATDALIAKRADTLTAKAPEVVTPPAPPAPPAAPPAEKPAEKPAPGASHKSK